jgi:hypothetical protein
MMDVQQNPAGSSQPRAKDSSSTFARLSKLMALLKVINAPRVGAQINDRQCKSLICEESENDIFRFPFSQKSRMDFWRGYPS